MKSLELHNKLNTELGEYLDVQSLNMKSTHKQHFLNKAIDQVFDNYYDVFEKNEKIRFGIGTLVKKAELTSNDIIADQNGAHTNGILLALPTGTYYTTKEYVKYDGNFIKVKPITYDYYESNIDNTRRKPYNSLFWRLDQGDDDTTTEDIVREIIHDGSVTDTTSFTYHMHYIKRPERVNIKDNTNVDMGFKPVDEAISIAANMIFRYYSNNQKEQQ